MNILLINHYAGSPAYGMEYRPYYLAREWVRMGHRVQIVAASCSHVRSRQPSAPAGTSATRWSESIDGIEYRWVRTPPYQGNGLGRVRNIASFLARVAADSGALVRDFAPNVVIASSTYPMDIWVARHIARKAGAKLVFEVHDLWPLSPIELNGMSPRHPFALLCGAAEKTAYRGSDLVVSMLPAVHAHATGLGLDAQRLAIVPNGIALEEWSGDAGEALRSDVSQCLKAARRDGHFLLGYAGAHGVPNALDTLLDAAALMRDEPVQFVLVGDGHERARLVERVRAEGLHRVSMFPPIPKAQIRALLAAVDIAYLGAPRKSIYRFGVSPNKMLDYMMAGVPILYAIEAGNDPVSEAACGLSVVPGDAAALASAIRQLRSAGHETLQRMGQNGKQYAVARHTYDVLASRFLDAIHSQAVKA